MQTAQMIADRVPMHIRAEAARYADRVDAQYEDMPKIIAAIAHREFMRNIEPLMEMRRRMVLGFSMTRYIYGPDGLQAEPVEYPEAVARALSDVDEMIASEARKLGLDAPTSAMRPPVPDAEPDTPHTGGSSPLPI